MGLFGEVGIEISRILREAAIIRALDIDGKWKGLFFKLVASRGFRDVKEYTDKMIDIANNETEVVLLFLEGKLIGLDMLHIVATEMDTTCQARYYKSVKVKGVKHKESVSIFESCISGKRELDLFDFCDY